MACYLTGKALRDRLLEQPLSANEWLCRGRSAASLQGEGLEAVAGSAPCYRDPQTGEVYWPWCAERWDRERDRLNRYCDASLAVDEVLAVRDLTIHAMARDERGELIDPHDGWDDLQQGFLRHVTPHFARHPDYLLAIAEAAAELVHWGFRVAHGTYGLMKKMAAGEAIRAIDPAARAARIPRALDYPTPSEYFRVLHRCGALAQWSPALSELYARASPHAADPGPPPLLERVDRARHEQAAPFEVFVAAMAEYDRRILADLGLNA